MVDAWFADIDAEMETRWPAEQLATLKIRERITTLVETRIDLLAPGRESLRRAQALHALATHGPHAAKPGWRAAEPMWRSDERRVGREGGRQCRNLRARGHSKQK